MAPSVAAVAAARSACRRQSLGGRRSQAEMLRGFVGFAVLERAKQSDRGTEAMSKHDTDFLGGDGWVEGQTLSLPQRHGHS